ncbi:MULTISPECIES: ATP-dependent RNA helicase HrpA [unclassified Cobetia]|uniref:ATP-dependent RNA helicase HrpA n=1 Tax=unclassified Cobetia TaxID=2609414 RepID=UPI00178CAEF6|nr:MULTISPECIES: ATP-dependent RNA helicase HrpA [unclassified Cobetia]MBE2168632.1 ATP-dependent RNA helicase HrpA [Cobetia sp. 2AS1]MDH2447800.1 ATP-dependent RNA helicase HrpA [Cobetia sp. 2AS]
MSDTATAPSEHARLEALAARLERALSRDQRELGKRLAGLRRRLKEGKPVDRAINDIESRLEASIAQRAARETALARWQTPAALNYPPELPVVERREDILAALAEHQIVVVAGETGSGKTTQLPKLCLEMGLGRNGLIGHTQPRRLAARSVAARLAEELETTLGETVGYQVRFNDTTGPSTLIKLMTDGILLAETQHDPDLSRYEAIIIDEAHERSLNIDFLLGYLKRLTARRPDLKIIITSATIDVERFSQHFAAQDGTPAPIVSVSGRNFPVETQYLPLVRDAEDEEDLSLQEGILRAVEELSVIEREKGWLRGPRDVLIFLPGEREIRATADTLRRAQLRDTEVLPLYARLSNEEQNRVFQPHRGRRIVLATNVAETSLTVPGIRYVIDPGLVRISRYSYRSKIQRLPVEPISQASANQRKGRCGRIAEGLCIRLYSEEDFLARPEYTEPEIQRTNLASVILSMLSLKLGDIEKFPFVDAPDSRFVTDGFRLLRELGAVDEHNRLSRDGRTLARLPIDPRLARMVLEGASRGCLREVLIIVSALSIQDPRERPADKRQQADQIHHEWDDDNSDFVSWLNLWEGFELARDALGANPLRRWCKARFLNYLRLREWHDTFRQLKQLTRDLGLEMTSAQHERDAEAQAEVTARVLASPGQGRRPSVAIDHESLHRALLTGLLSNLGLKQENREYLGARNRRFFVHPGSGVAKKSPKWVMAAEMVETTKLYARQVAAIKPEWVEPLAEHLVKRSYSEPHWEMKRAQVVASEQVTLFGLPIVTARKVHYGPLAPEESRELFIRRALVEGEFQTRAPFFAHNRGLMDEVGELEDRARKRDILVDEETLFAFYAERIPEGIYNGRSFDKWRKEAERDNPDVLHLNLDDLMARDAEEVTVARYPEQLHHNSVAYPLSYHFAPGAVDDGVTMIVPAAMLSQLPRYRIEWLVPGLLRDKAIALMKSLPKQYRKQVVPIPNWVDAALEALTPDDVPLTDALAEFMRVKTGLRLPQDAWAPETLEPHLKMNLRIVDQDGKVLGEGRDLEALEARFKDSAAAAARAMANRSREADSEVLEDLPETPIATSHSTTQAGIRVEAYPALVVKAAPADSGMSAKQRKLARKTGKNSAPSSHAPASATAQVEQNLSVELFDHPAKAAAAHRDGITRLAMARLPDQVRYLDRDLKALERCALLFAKVGTRRQLADDFIYSVFEQVMAVEPLPRSRSELQARLDDKRAELVPHAEALLKPLEAALKQHLELSKRLKGKIDFSMALVVADLKAQQARLITPGFIQASGEWLHQLPRYVEAMLIRLDKAPRERMRDQRDMEEVKGFESRLDARLSKAREQGLPDAELEEFGWWLQELRVSLFAQQLGTLETVSAKRLEKRWQELMARR